ncbi:MAG TPA: HEAT repeat domain-containing protein [Pyrinomonadaceae bacterium]
MRTKLLVALVAAVSLSALLLAGGAAAQRTARQANDNASGAKSKRVVGVRSSDTGSGSRVSITADDSLKDYSAYRSGDRFYVVLPKAAAGARGGGSGRGYSDMQVQQRGDSVVLSYRVQPGAKPRVEQKFNRLDVVFDVPGGDAGQQAAATNNAARQQQQQQQTTPAENRNAAAQQNNQTQTTTNVASANPTPERRQPTAEETARAQAANTAAANTTTPAVTSAPAVVDPAAQNPAATTPEPTPATTPAVETQIAQAPPPTTIAPITTNQPAAANQTGTSLGAFLVRNWALALVFALVVVGLGLIFVARRTTSAAPAPVEELKDSAAKLEEPRASRAKETTAAALKDASSAAQASTVNAAKSSTVSTAETVGTADASGADVTPLVAATALAGGAAAAKSRKQSRKEARQEAKRKKKGTLAEEPALAEEPTAAAPIVGETVVEEPSVEEATVEVVAPTVTEETAIVEPVAEETLAHEEPTVETLPVEQTAAAEETFVDESAVVETPPVEEVAQPEAVEQSIVPAVETFEPEHLHVAESGLETAATAFVASEVETTEIAPTEPESAEPFVAEMEAPAVVTAIEPADSPDPERVLDETRRVLEGEEYDRAVVGSRDAMARQMIAAELLSALAGRNAQRRERAGRAFVEHGYFDETARDLREADAPAERSAAARSLAILGDRGATPLLVAALEDPVSDVRRAAVEALGALRDPAAVEPLEALLERERTERNRIPPRVIRTAVEFCREGLEQAPPVETQAVIPAVETSEPAPTLETEAAPVEEATGVVDAPPAEEPVVETAPFAEVATQEAAEETSAAIEPYVEESFEPEPFIAPEPASEATGEPAHVPEPVHTEESVEAVAETAVEPFVEPQRPFVDFEEEVAETREEVAVEPFAGQEEEVTAAGTFDLTSGASETRQAELFDAGAEGVEEVTREIEPVAADTTKELAPVAGEWVDFDISDMGGEQEPVADTTAATTTPATPEPVFEFETSSGETLTSPAGVEAEETAPAVEAHTETTREIEVVDETAEALSFLREPTPARAAYEPEAYEPAAETREKGLAPFDESSTVPASIQQRIASRDPRERAAAIIDLSHVDTDEAFQQICAAFDDDSRDVRAAAARALYELRPDRADSFTRALREATPERRREIGAAISASGLAGESISQLTGESRERTYEAFSLLFLMARAGEVQPLLRAIEGHPNNEVRLAVVKLLALSGQKEVLPAFRRLAVRGSLPTEVRSAVMEAIYQISSSQPTHA